ncbi:hypothetical protein MRX96_020190 [Rhipicephalus microplus]
MLRVRNVLVLPLKIRLLRDSVDVDEASHFECEEILAQERVLRSEASRISSTTVLKKMPRHAVPSRAPRLPRFASKSTAIAGDCVQPQSPQPRTISTTGFPSGTWYYNRTDGIGEPCDDVERGGRDETNSLSMRR